MGDKQIRIGQLIAPFGPGSIYTDRRGIPLVVAGLDNWYKSWDRVLGRMVDCSNPDEFELFEPRLSELLHVDRFRAPPDYRAVRRGGTPPPNAALHVPALRFPRWYRHTRTGEMRKFNLDTIRIQNPPGGGRWQPVRFIAVCSEGHLCDFPWKAWLGCQCPGDGDLYLTDRGGSELSSIRVECRSCPEGSDGRRGKTLSGTTSIPDTANGEQSAFQRRGIVCPGERPWIGESGASCTSPLVGALINQTNIYFARTISAISLPALESPDSEVERVRALIEQDQSSLGVAITLWRMSNIPGAVALVKSSLTQRGETAEDQSIEAAMGILFTPGAASLPSDAPTPRQPESELSSFRRAEFNILRREINDPENIQNLRVIPSDVPELLSDYFSKINLVERLRETRVYYGFDRLEQQVQPLDGMPETAMNQLFRNPPTEPQERWLPGIEVFGEGIYLELNEDRLAAWQQANEEWITNRLNEEFLNRVYNVHQTLPPQGPATREWLSRYLVIHSLAHILINQLVFNCGYSTASLKERLFVSSDPDAPMAGFLVYTAAGDSEGTLGGLVQLGRPEIFSDLLVKALSRASWCSADPVCSEHLGGQGSKLANLAACHSCILLPETSCETINQGLDRSMIVGTPEDREMGFMSDLLGNTCVIE